MRQELAEDIRNRVIEQSSASARAGRLCFITNDSFRSLTIFVDDQGATERFLLGYLNSRLATYFMKRIVNTTATADIGYVEKLPFRVPDAETEVYVGERVDQIIELLKADAAANISALRDEIDDRILDLFGIRAARDTVWRFYDTVGRVENAAAEDSEATT